MKFLIWLLLTCILLPRDTLSKSVSTQEKKGKAEHQQSDSLHPQKSSKKQKGLRARSSLPGPRSVGLESGSTHYSTNKFNSDLQPRDGEIGTAENGPVSNDIIQDFVQSDAPMLWSDTFNGKKMKSHEHKKTEEGLNEMTDDGLPNTVGPNPNIFGGFPENENWGGFQLPSPEKLEILKQTLHPIKDHVLDFDHMDTPFQNYDYEHHALPEYDVKETPPFQIAVLQGMKLMEEENKAKKPKIGTGMKPCAGSCPPSNLHTARLNSAQCQTLSGWCKPKKPPTEGQYELPCPYKILEKLYGCKLPIKSKEKPPVVPPVEKPEELLSEKPELPEIPPFKKPKKTPFEKPPKKEDENINKKPDEKENEKLEKKPDEKENEKLEKKPEKASPSLPPALLQTQGDTKSEPIINLTVSNVSQKEKTFPGNEVGQAIPIKGHHEVHAMSANTTAQRLQQQLALLNLIQGQSASEANSDKIGQQTGRSRNEENIPDFSDWSQWTPCSVTCSKGTTSRARYCKKAKCVEKVIDVKQCIRRDCPEYADWSQWSECDVKCGKGRTYRVRRCPEKKCPGIATEEKACFKDSCPELGTHLTTTIMPLLHLMVTAPPVPWTKWSPCTATCGFGMSTRKRNCRGPTSCRQYRELVETRTCMQHNCKVIPKLIPSDAQSTCLRLQNLYRILHGSPQLEWSDELSKKATDMASYLLAQGITSSNFENFEKPGVSIAELDKNSGVKNLKEVCSEITRKWYSEQKKFDFNNPHLSPENKHFTQMIWKSTSRLGLGMTKSAEGDRIYFVSVYDPPGNEDSYQNFKKQQLSAQVKSVVTNILNS